MTTSSILTISGFALQFALLLFAFGRIYGRFMSEIKALSHQYEELSNALEGYKNKMDARLYQPNGQTLFVTRTECANMQNQCSAHVCSKIDSLKSSMSDLLNARRTTDLQVNESLQKLLQFMGRVEQYMENHKQIKS